MKIKHRWIRRTLLALCTLLALVLAVVIYLSWPNSGTLVGQASKDDIQGLKRSLFLGADINGFQKWGWNREIDGKTPLSSAAWYSKPETVIFLLERGADPNQRDGFGTPPIVRAAIKGRKTICEILIKHGTDPQLPDVGIPERTASDWARLAKHFELADYLDSLE